MDYQFSPLNDGNGTSTSVDTMPNGNGSSSASVRSSSASVKSKKKMAKKMKQPELSEPLTAGDGGDDQQWDENEDPELGSSRQDKAPVDDDPFYVFRDDLLRKLSLADEALGRYLKVVHGTDTAANSHEVKDAKKQLKRQIKNSESTLKDLQTSIRLVEDRRDKFLHIDDVELNERRNLVSTSHDRIRQVRSDMNSDDVKSKLMTDERAMARRRSGDMGAQTDLEKENTAFIHDSRAKAQMMLQQQDETLDDLDEAVTRVGNVASSIHEELGEQNKMLHELEDDLADAEEKLGLVMGKLAKLLKTKNKCQIGIILSLSLVVLVLFFLVIYT